MSCSWGQIFVSCFLSHADQAALDAAVNCNVYCLFHEVAVTDDGQMEKAEDNGKHVLVP